MIEIPKINGKIKYVPNHQPVIREQMESTARLKMFEQQKIMVLLIENDRIERNGIDLRSHEVKKLFDQLITGFELTVTSTPGP